MRTVLPTVFAEAGEDGVDVGVDVDVGCEESEEAGEREEEGEESEERGEEEEEVVGGQAQVDASPRTGVVQAVAVTATSTDQRITTNQYSLQYN